MNPKQHTYKLIRDLVPEAASLEGKMLRVRTANTDELPILVGDKLVEESGEFRENPNLDELADVLEVVEKILHVHGWTWAQVNEARQNKRTRLGGFSRHIVLTPDSERQ